MLRHSSTKSNHSNWLISRLTERNCLILLILLFLVLSFIIGSIPYLPETDHADATTNDIWIEYYPKGVYHIPYDKWNYSPTQSVVVWHEGEYVVVNEKGPGHVIMMIPFHLMGVDVLFGPLMVFLAVFSAFMLGKRLINWRVGILSAALVLTNVTVLVMWYRSYWTDASTMHMLLLSAWLLIESNYWLNGKSLDPRKYEEATNNQRILAVGIGILSGLAFGASVSTRYATALMVIALFLYILMFYFARAWPHLKKREIKEALLGTARMWVLLGVFVLGLMVVLIPLMQYNSTYFGGPFRSGYDETLVTNFDLNQGLTPRNTSDDWSSGFSLSVAFDNFVDLQPILINRMPVLLLAPIGIWFLRKRPIVLIFLLTWILINFATYLSLTWTEMYSNIPLNTLHEPRYFMPSLLAIAMVGGVAIDGLASWISNLPKSRRRSPEERKKMKRVLFTVGVTGVLVLLGLVPALVYFANLEYGGALRPPQQPLPAIIVTTDNLINDPFRFVDKDVRVLNAIVLDVHNNILVIRSMGSVEVGGVTVRLVNWPPGELPQIDIGDRVDVQGRFTLGPPPGEPQNALINVRFDSRDYIRVR